jgi:hypothetical protein
LRPFRFIDVVIPGFVCAALLVAWLKLI